jgi:ketosteroid isomerase-like protein
MTTNAPFLASLREGVDQAREQHVAAVNAGDARAATDLFAPEGVFLPPNQPALQGTAAIHGWFTHVFANFRIQGFGLQPGTLEPHDDVMIEHGNWNATFQPKDGSPSLPAGGTYLTVYGRLSDGRVRMIRDAFNGLPG